MSRRLDFHPPLEDNGRIIKGGPMLKDLLGNLLGGILGGGKAGKVDSSLLTQGLGKLLSSQGGLNGLIRQFQQKGLGDLIGGWVSTGPNPKITPRQVKKGLGPDLIEQFAKATGLKPRAATAKLAQILPKAVDGMTPDGKVPAEGSSLEDALGLLKKIF